MPPLTPLLSSQLFVSSSRALALAQCIWKCVWQAEGAWSGAPHRIKERQQRKKLAAANRGHDTAAFSGDGGNGPQFKKQKQPADESPPPTVHREQFAYILLDGPCSALGLRPRLTQPVRANPAPREQANRLGDARTTTLCA
jgi:hypothetical protein